MNIFVTGGSGFIGKSFIKEASKKKNFIFSLTRKKQKNLNSKVKNLFGGLDKDWSKYLKKTDVLVHLAAAGVQPNKTKRKVIFKTNITDSLKFIKNAVDAGCKNFLIISTSSEYGHKSKKIKKIGTKFKRKPKNPYSVSKVKFTDLIKKLSGRKEFQKCKFRIMRIFPIYGPNENSYRLYPSLKNAAEKGKNFLIKNPLEYRDFTDSNYASKILLNACDFKKNSKKFEIYHVSSNNKMTVMKFAEIMWKRFKAKGKLITKNKKVFLSTHVSDRRSVWKLKKNVKRR
jgi:nucleoside-diphosphate-sugar epimerase